MIVYISGPITGKKNYKNVFMEAERKLRMGGCEVINPAEIADLFPKSFRHGDYMDIDLVLLDKADAILMLPGYEKSQGASMELGYAIAKGKVVFKDV